MMSTSYLTLSKADFQTFHPFSRLPPELRIKIWRDALPERDSPALVPYQDNGWLPATGFERENTHSSNDTVVEGQCHYQPRDKIRVKIPLASVNTEAREIAIEWARKQGIDTIFHKDRRCLIFQRRFDPMHDVLWTGQGAFETFANKCSELYMPIHSQGHVSEPVNVRRFAVPEDLVKDDASFDLLCTTICNFCANVVIYVIAGEHPGNDAMDADSTKSQPRWEVDSTHEGESILWDRYMRKFYVESGGPQILHEDAYKRVLRFTELISRHITLFIPDARIEIRAALAIRL